MGDKRLKQFPILVLCRPVLPGLWTTCLWCRLSAAHKRERGAHGTVLAPPREVSPYSYDRRPPAFSPPSLRVWAARSPLQKRARALAGLRLHCAAMPSRCAGLGKPCPKGCGGCNFASTRSATHSCTPEFAHSDRSELTGSYAIGTNKVLWEARWPRGRAALQRDGDRGGLRMRPLPRRGLERRRSPKAQPWPAAEDPVAAA